jgi:hypothetical protein
MTRRVIVTFSGSPYHQTTEAIVKNANRFGSDEVFVYDDTWLLQQEFARVNSWLFDHPHKRGCGWYAFKALCLQNAMSRIGTGNILMWLDSDTVPVSDHSALYALCDKEDAVFFEVSPERHEPATKWTKRDCFVAMGLDSSEYHNSRNVCARFALFKKGSWRVNQLLQEWLVFMTHRYANTFDPSVLAPEFPNFVEHRCDQSILGLLAHKYGFREPRREPCQNGNAFGHDREYNQLFVQLPCEQKYLNVTCPADGSEFFNMGPR